MSVSNWSSTAILLILLAGFLLRKTPYWHIRLMSTAFALDVILVLYIEITRHAIEKVITQSISPLLIFHIAVSLTVLGLYTYMARLGAKMAKGDESARKKHVAGAWAFAACRLTNYVTSFYIVTH